jgi:hypothetical protein
MESTEKKLVLQDNIKPNACYVCYKLVLRPRKIEMLSADTSLDYLYDKNSEQVLRNLEF